MSYRNCPGTEIAAIQIAMKKERRYFCLQTIVAPGHLGEKLGSDVFHGKPKIQGLLYFEVVGHKVSRDGNGGGVESEILRRKMSARDLEEAREKAKGWMKRNFLKARVDDYILEVRPIPTRKPRPDIPIRRPPVCRVSRDAI